jgi:hypothetical protein
MAERQGTERLHMNVIMVADERNQPGISLRSTYPDNT